MKKVLALLMFCVAAFAQAARVITINNTSDFSAWLASQQTGDTLLFAGDVGTQTNPLVGKVTASGVTFDVAPNAHPNLLWNLDIHGDHFTGKNLVTDFTGAPPPTTGASVYMLLKPYGVLDHVTVITGNVNSWPGLCSMSGPTCKGRQAVLSSADAGPGVVVKNSTAIGGHHGFYAQVNAADAPKVIDSNIVIWDVGCGSNCGRYALHGYTESAQVQGLVAKRNIMAMASALVGGNINGIPSGNVADQNFLYQGSLVMDYGNPALTPTATGNTIIHGSLIADAVRAGGIKITGNRIIDGALTMRPSDGTKIPNSTSWNPVDFVPPDYVDNNTYTLLPTGKVQATHWLPNHDSNVNSWTMAQIRTKMQAHGCGLCDAGSVALTVPSNTNIVQMYPTGTNRGHVAVVSYGNTTPHAVTIDLSPLVLTGAYVSVFDAQQNPYTATSLWSGAYTGPVSIQMQGEFVALRVEPFTPPTATPTPTKTNTPPMICQTATPTPKP